MTSVIGISLRFAACGGERKTQFSQGWSWVIYLCFRLSYEGVHASEGVGSRRVASDGVGSYLRGLLVRSIQNGSNTAYVTLNEPV